MLIICEKQLIRYNLADNVIKIESKLEFPKRNNRRINTHTHIRDDL